MYNIVKDRIVESNMKNNPSDFSSKAICEYRRGVNMSDNIIMAKYQGLGNDYLILDAVRNRVQIQGKKAALLCQRGFGLGADGVLYGPVQINGKMGVHIFNADGSESPISGNGVRIFAKYLIDQGYVKESKFDIETMAGTIEVEVMNARATEFRVKMGKASFISEEIPVTGEKREIINETFTFNEKEYKATCLTVGNPHCIIFADKVSKEAVKELGPYVENADEFPNRMNLQLCRLIDRGNLDIEIWERGSGYTKASGTGSCAAAAAAYRLGLVEPRINVNQPGGMIQINIKEDGTIYMTGTVGFIADISIAQSFFS